MTTPVWIGLGSNLGDRRAILDAAIVALADVPSVFVRSVSSYHETSPVGGPPGQGPFLNAAAHLETTHDAYQLLAALQDIEDQAGRVRIVRWGERTLDLDILIFGTKFLDTKELKLPHPRLAFRRFVLGPLAEIAPHIVDTMTKQTVVGLLANLDRTPRLLALAGTNDPSKESVFRRLVNDLPAFGIAQEELLRTIEKENDPFPVFIETLEQKIKTLRSSLWSVDRRVSWIATDFCLGFDLQRAFSTYWWKNLPESRKSARIISDRKKLQQIRELARDAVQATIVLLLPSIDRKHRRPGVIDIPQLWPESDDPEAIVAEVLATCRGIEAV